ncbi:MAG: pilus assembly protein [Bdellovibrionales bacterium]|nr:pilus assembly protein [Bdellovibrionales bacterium]
MELHSRRVILSRSSLREASREQGATLVEFSLVALLLLSLLFTFLDFAHYLTLRAVMIKGAQDALEIALKTDQFQYELSEYSSTSDEYLNEFVPTRADIIAKAVSLPLATLASPEGSGGLVELLTFSAEDRLSNTEVELSGMQALVLRPGDIAVETVSGLPVHHPYSKPAGERMVDSMKSQPVIIQLRAKKKFFLPLFLNELPVNVTAVGWAQQYPKSGFNLQDFLADAPGPGGPEDDPDECVPDPSCGSWSWPPDCECCDEPTEHFELCANGGTWEDHPSVCGCDCSSAGYCEHGYEWNCACRPCPPPADGSCACWDFSSCSCPETCQGN